MAEIIELQNYAGELKLDCDEVNTGALWYASYYNTKKNNVSMKHQERLPNPANPRLTRGIEISASKFLKSGGYSPKYNFSKLKLLYQLGYGAYSLVWMAMVGNSEKVAVKQFNVTTVRTDTIWKERDLLIFLKHKRICNIVGAFFDCDAFIVMELCIGSLNTVMPQISPRNAVRFGIQIAEALEWCHSKNIIHCDIKPNNLLLTSSNNVVLADFGQAVILPKATAVVKSTVSLGVPQYQDYESNIHFTYSTATDMYSFGCIFFEIVTCQFLIQYNIGEVPIEEYIQVPKKGRLRNLTSWPQKTTELERERLEDRVRKHAGKFTNAILGLIDDRSYRWTVKKFLSSADIQNSMRDVGIFPENLDNDCTNLVAKEQKRMSGRQFEFTSKGDFDTKTSAFNRFYYDENEVGAKPVERKALQSYEAHVIAVFLESTESVSKLNELLAQNDPVADAQLLSLVNKWLGLPTRQNFHSNKKTGPRKFTDPAKATANVANSRGAYLTEANHDDAPQNNDREKNAFLQSNHNNTCDVSQNPAILAIKQSTGFVDRSKKRKKGLAPKTEISDNGNKSELGESPEEIDQNNKMGVRVYLKQDDTIVFGNTPDNNALQPCYDGAPNKMIKSENLKAMQHSTGTFESNVTTTHDNIEGIDTSFGSKLLVSPKKGFARQNKQISVVSWKRETESAQKQILSTEKPNEAACNSTCLDKNPIGKTFANESLKITQKSNLKSTDSKAASGSSKGNVKANAAASQKPSFHVRDSEGSSVSTPSKSSLDSLIEEDNIECAYCYFKHSDADIVKKHMKMCGEQLGKSD